MRDKLELINGKKYILRFYEDNSAPCSNCVFLKRSTLTCDHPNKSQRNCFCASGTNKGWNTREYCRW